MRVSIRHGAQGERGATIVITALCLFALIGFTSLTVDVAMLHVYKQKHVNGCDSAALAAAQEMLVQLRNGVDLTTAQESYAKPEAQLLAGRNGLPSAMPADWPSSDGIRVTFPSANRVKVESIEHVPLAFARVFGLATKPVGAATVAGFAVVNGVHGGSGGGSDGIRPFGVDDRSDFQYGQVYPLVMGPPPTQDPSLPAGNFYPLALNEGRDGRNYYDAVAYGSDLDWHVGDMVTTEPGEMSWPQVVNRLNDLVRQAERDPTYSQQTIADATLDNPRVILVPVVRWASTDGDYLTKNGRGQVQIVGFAAFWIDSAPKPTGKQEPQILGTFLKYVDVPNGSYDPSYPSPSSDYGLYDPVIVE